MDNKSKWLFGGRMTSGNPKEAMENNEWLLNNCYAEGGKAMYRDHDGEYDIRHLIVEIAKTLSIHINATSPDALDFMLFDWLEDGIESRYGILALLYNLFWSKAELYEKLKQYEDAEERGEIGRVPRWIPVTERMPEDDCVPGDKTIQIKVMVCNVNNGSRSIRTLTRCWDRWLSIDGNVREWKWRWTWSKNVRDNEITHWMSLSALPEVIGNGNDGW